VQGTGPLHSLRPAAAPGALGPNAAAGRHAWRRCASGLVLPLLRVDRCEWRCDCCIPASPPLLLSFLKCLCLCLSSSFFLSLPLSLSLCLFQSLPFLFSLSFTFFPLLQPPRRLEDIFMLDISRVRGAVTNAVV
jgi:hypothetical protein